MVTGANSGVGFEVAQYLARRGAEVQPLPLSAFTMELRRVNRELLLINEPKLVDAELISGRLC